jgi:multidrug efflux pump subunit AcrA (membrane-fusion protein)
LGSTIIAPQVLALRSVRVALKQRQGQLEESRAKADAQALEQLQQQRKARELMLIQQQKQEQAEAAAAAAEAAAEAAAAEEDDDDDDDSAVSSLLVEASSQAFPPHPGFSRSFPSSSSSSSDLLFGLPAPSPLMSASRMSTATNGGASFDAFFLDSGSGGGGGGFGAAVLSEQEQEEEEWTSKPKKVSKKTEAMLKTAADTVEKMLEVRRRVDGKMGW